MAELSQTVGVLQQNSACCMDRVKHLERQMENSNVLVKGLDSEMDMLIQDMTGDNPEQPVVSVQIPRSSVSPHDNLTCTNDSIASIHRNSQQLCVSSAQEQMECLPAPAALRCEENFNGEIDCMLAREEFSASKQQ